MWMKRFEPQTYALFRIMTGFLFLWHGVQKLFGYPEAIPPGVPAYITYIAGPIELLGGILVMFGLCTRSVWGTAPRPFYPRSIRVNSR